MRGALRWCCRVIMPFVPRAWRSGAPATTGASSLSVPLIHIHAQRAEGEMSMGALVNES